MLPIFGEKKEFNVQDYLEILLKRKWIIVISLVIALALGFLFLLVAPRIYMTNTVLLIEKEVPKITQIRDDVYSEEKGNIQTQAGILNSRYLAERVIKKMKLNIGLDPRSVDRFLSTIRIERSGDVFVLQVFGVDPVLITDIANTWVKEFIRQDIERRMGTTEYGVIWLEDQLSETLRDVQAVEKELAVLSRTNVDLLEIEEVIEGLKKKKIELEENIAQSARVYGELHPKIVFLKEQLELAKTQLTGNKVKLEAYQEEVWQYKMLTEKAETYRKLYNNLLTRSRELDISKDLAVTNIRIVDVARVPTVPVSPQAVRSILFAVGVGLFGGLGIILLIEFLDTSLNKPEEVELFANMPFLGYTPSVTKDIKRGQNINLLTKMDSYSQAAEAFRNIKVSLIFSSPEDKPLKKIIVTSANPGEGKTFVASNLAEVFAHASEETLLIDGDLKKGQLAKTFGLKPENGLTSVLAGLCPLEKAIVKTDMPNLSLLASGPSAPNPSELLGSEKLKEVMLKLGEKFQRIIIDVPGILAASDVLFWDEVSDGMVQVIGAGVTPLNAIKEARKRVEGKITVIGGILNNLKIERDAAFYFHYFKETVQKTKREMAAVKTQKKKTETKEKVTPKKA